MTSERHAWATLHPFESPARRRQDTCSCGQELDTCSGRHCPRCGTAVVPGAR